MFKRTRNTFRKIKRNRVRILTYSTLALGGAVAIQRTGLKQHDDFLKEKGLYNEFYFSEE